jgi:8-oxo-dGTP pyrophosphatase MutT (NUDIX family)
LVVALLLSSACAADEYDAAGVIAYLRIQGKTYVLLADHLDSDRGWGTFGGQQEKAESPVEIACREFREETRCVYDLRREDVSGMPTVAQGNFLSYVVEVPFVPAQFFGSKEASSNCKGPEYNERGPWAWIPLDEIVRCLENAQAPGEFRLPKEYLPQGSRTKLWKNSATIIQKAIQGGSLE